MKATFEVCDRCSKVLPKTPYSLVAYNHRGEPDGSFEVCWPCYKELTDLLNKECHGQARQIMDDFLQEFNKRFTSR